MHLEKLQQLIAKSESKFIEFKKLTGSRTEAAKTICALLNGLGGHLLSDELFYFCLHTAIPRRMQ